MTTEAAKGVVDLFDALKSALAKKPAPLPEAPPPDSFTDETALDTVPTPCPPPLPRSLDLSRTPGVLSLVRSAETWTIAGQHDRARVYATTALVELAKLLGVDARGCELIELQIPSDDYASGVVRGAIIEDDSQFFSHLAGEPTGEELLP